MDSSGWLEYFADGPNADVFAKPILDAAELIVPTISITEVFKRMNLQRGEEAALIAVTAMRRGRVIDLTSQLAVSAAQLGIELKLALADSIILATARAQDATIWTQDADFEAIEGVRYYPKVK
ncbi:MAG: type II toxin-antitoxin system VapC family toxin [Tepidisphaeraceae bacterium]